MTVNCEFHYFILKSNREWAWTFTPRCCDEKAESQAAPFPNEQHGETARRKLNPGTNHCFLATFDQGKFQKRKAKSRANLDLSTAINGEVGPCRKYDELDWARVTWHVSDDFHSSGKAEDFWHLRQSETGATFESHVAALRWWRNRNPSLSTVS